MIPGRVFRRRCPVDPGNADAERDGHALADGDAWLRDLDDVGTGTGRMQRFPRVC
jgi:hypothetical protein